LLQKLNLTDAKRVFVVGDIHGEFTLFERNLVDLGFDHLTDHVLSVGDLVDRGPESNRAVEFLNQPWFHAVRGNHEQMVIDAGGTYWHTQNGGEWFTELTSKQQFVFVARFKQLPLAIEATLRDGRRIGIVHASVPSKMGENLFPTDWNNTEYMFTAAGRGREYLDIMWDRYSVGRAKKYAAMPYVKEHRMREFLVENIDHVYMGHTPMKQPLTLGNCTWLDTGAFATGNLTVIEL
jgi:serine/threonine protein phosphatase 1